MGSGARPASSSALSAAAASTSARGFPPAASVIRRATSAATSAQARSSSSSRAASASRPSRESVSSPANGLGPSPSKANNIAIPSTFTLRAAKASAEAEAGSTMCASSTTQRIGRDSAAAASTLRMARKTAPCASFADGARSNAARNASRWGAGIPSTSSTTGDSSSSSPEKEIWDSASIPAVCSTSNPSARSIACASSAVFPDPAAPQITSTPLWPERASARSPSIRPHSTARPCTSAREAATAKGLSRGREPSPRDGIRRPSLARQGPRGKGRLHGSVIGGRERPLYLSCALGLADSSCIRRDKLAAP